MKEYKYRPFTFFALTFAFTWGFWIAAIFAGEELSLTFASLGLFVPATVAFTMVMTSKSRALKDDYKRKFFGLASIKPLNILLSVVLFFIIILVSILISLLFGQSTDQFLISGGFSFSVGGMPTLFLIILTALLEELGWRGYAEDAIASGCTWFKESVIFGIVWALWHFPLLFIPGMYHYNILHMNPLFALNFFISVMPLGFLFTWVYVKSGRSIFACMIFHFFVNFLQEQIAITQFTKCIETFVLIAATIIVVLTNKDLFFEKRHIGNILSEDKQVSHLY